MKMIFKKSILFALIAALGVASLAFVSASASGLYDAPILQGQISNARLERVWTRQLRIYARIGRTFERADQFTAKVQGWIDRADENGKDVSAVQAALDAFEAALKDAHSIYESAKGILNSHPGFDEDGKVTGTEKAKETVQAMAEKLREIRSAMNGTGRALLEALRAFRQDNPSERGTPTP